MFPLHEDTIFNLGLIAVGASMAVFTAWHGRAGFWAYATLFTVALIWPWPIALALGPDHYTIGAAFYLSAFTLLAVSVGTVWGLTARRVTAGAMSFVVASVPALAGAAYLLERQRVPDAPCAERAHFSIGDLTVAIPRGMGARSVVANDAPEQAWQGSYSDWPGAKPDARSLCVASEGGRETIQVHHLWLPFGWFRKANAADCKLKRVPDELASYCEAIARTQLTVVQLYARPDGMPFPTLSHFNREQVVSRLSAGETAGYRCNDPTGGPQTRYCTIWQPLSPEVLAVSSAKLGPVMQGEIPVSDAEVVLRTLLSQLGPREGL